MQRDRCDLVWAALLLSFPIMNWERWSAGRLAAQNRLFVWKVAAAQGCGTRRHVKDPDSVPGNPEQTGGGGSHEDSGSFCGVFFQRYTLF